MAVTNRLWTLQQRAALDQFALDAMLYGQSLSKLQSDGSLVRIPPPDIYLTMPREYIRAENA